MKSMRQKFTLCTVLLVAFVAAGFAGVATAATQQIAYAWTTPTTRADGSALTAAELAGYNIYYTINGGTPQKLAVALGTSTSATLSLSLAPKSPGYTVVSAITAIDTEGLESAQSAPITTKLTVVNALPSPPTNMKLSVTCASGSCSMVVQ